jgi:hypothetical protein
MTYTFPVTITDVFERKLRKHVSGAGPDAIFTTDSDGWYLQVGGVVTICVGPEQPIIRPGEKMELVLRKPERSQR